MSYIDQQRLALEVLSLDWDGVRRGEYSDQYFNNTTEILADLSERKSSEDRDLVAVGNREVDFQIFTKRAPQAVVVGTDLALILLKKGCGYLDSKGSFVSTASKLEVRSLWDGQEVQPWNPVMRLRGKYRDFAYLETLILGFFSRGSMIGTNVYEALKSAGGKPVLYFSARFDLPQVQELDGYAYKIAVDHYNHQEGLQVPIMVSTNAQGRWFGARGGGTTPHAYLLCFLKDTARALFYFAQQMPPSTLRIALVDVNNNCIKDSLAVAGRLFGQYSRLMEDGHRGEAEKFKLYGVRVDTSETLRDRAIPPLGHPDLDCGVTPRLVFQLRQALDQAPETLDLSEKAKEMARQYYRAIKIFCTGGFGPDKIARFERLGVPADGYGVGSSFLHGKGCDYTGDVVMARVGNHWIPMAKEGRKARDDERLKKVQL